MRFDLDDNVVIVTGGSNGIGTALVRYLADQGAKVAFTFHTDKTAAAELVSELTDRGGSVATFPYDLADPDGADRLVEDVLGAWGRVDGLVANAIAWPIMPEGRANLVDNDMDTWSRGVRANLDGTTAIARRAAKEMVAGGFGRIVVMSSEVGETGRAGASAYSTAKAALHGMVASLRWEIGPAGVLINLVSPGFNMTPRNLARFPDAVRDQVRERTPTRRLSTPEDVAPTVAFLLSEANTNITGEFLSVSGGAD